MLARELNFQAEYFGLDLCETVASLPGGEGLLEGCVFPDNEPSLDFREKYRSAYGNETLLGFAGNAYDMAILVGEVYQGKREINAVVFLKALAMVNNRRGVLGEFSYQSSSEVGQFFEYPVFVKKIKGGRGVPVIEKP